MVMRRIKGCTKCLLSRLVKCLYLAQFHVSRVKRIDVFIVQLLYNLTLCVQVQGCLFGHPIDSIRVPPDAHNVVLTLIRRRSNVIDAAQTLKQRCVRKHPTTRTFRQTFITIIIRNAALKLLTSLIAGSININLNKKSFNGGESKLQNTLPVQHKNAEFAKHIATKEVLKYSKDTTSTIRHMTNQMNDSNFKKLEFPLEYENTTIKHFLDTRFKRRCVISAEILK